MIAVHCGAGFHAQKNYIQYKRLCNKSCRAATAVLADGGTALEALKVAIRVLEDSELTNAGYGSNLTQDGFVECDAAIMDGKTLLYGGCGAVRQVKNPIDVAYKLCVDQLIEHPLGLIPPALLVGDGAIKYAKENGIVVVMNNRDLIGRNAMRQYIKYKKRLDVVQLLERLDTIGAVCLDNYGDVAAGSSSGGLILKSTGRVGQSALYASGVFADSNVPQKQPSIAVCTTGCGEHLVLTQLAKVIADDLKYCLCPTLELSKCMTDKFMDSRFLTRVKMKHCGALVLHVDKDGVGSVLWGHSTQTMAVGYMKCNGNPKSFISILPEAVEVGTKVNIGGIDF